MEKEMENKQVNNQPKVPECGYFLNTIYFYLTEGCNLKCRHCWIAPKFEKGNPVFPTLDFELFKDIIKQGKELGMSGVKLTGGEPLIHPDINKILDHIAEQGLRLTIETNGVECTQEIVKKILKCNNPFVSISLDGSEAETHEWVRGVEGCFEAALNGSRNLVKAGLRPQYIMSIMKNNADQMESVVRLAEKEGAESVKFNLVTPTARGEQMHDAGETLPIEKLVELGAWVENELEPKSKIRVVYSHTSAFRPLSKIFSKSSGRCGIFGIMGVLGSGKYALCGIGETVPELCFGHASKDKLADIWNNSSVLDDIRKELPGNLKGICKDCIMKNMCLGSCVAMNYYRHKDLFAPFWYCEEAYKAGIFPKTRLKPGSEHEKGMI
ncbi:MAG TPA: SynChlorMet cassette radical SAM/SPASM protein ScmF [Victivallales bacterium]|nr:SynChlorMet cassette radical SAM/SPASM protein ScmF [Victivallales bacterium]